MRFSFKDDDDNGRVGKIIQLNGGLSFENSLEFIDLGDQTKLVNRTEYISAEELKKVMDMSCYKALPKLLNRLEEHLKELKLGYNS